MTISELIVILERAKEDVGDVPVERNDGVEIIALSYVFEQGKKNPKVEAIQFR